MDARVDGGGQSTDGICSGTQIPRGSGPGWHRQASRGCRKALGVCDYSSDQAGTIVVGKYTPPPSYVECFAGYVHGAPNSGAGGRTDRTYARLGSGVNWVQIQLGWAGLCAARYKDCYHKGLVIR